VFEADNLTTFMCQCHENLGV